MSITPWEEHPESQCPSCLEHECEARTSDDDAVQFRCTLCGFQSNWFSLKPQAS